MTARLRVSEKQFSQQVSDLALLTGWKVYRTWTSVHSAAGFPDLVLARRRRVLFAELKSDSGKLTPAQAGWLEALRAADQEAYVWRPRDWPQIERAIGGGRSA